MSKNLLFLLPILLLAFSCNKSPTEELDPLAQQRAQLFEDYGLIELSVNGGKEIELYAVAAIYDSLSVSPPRQLLSISGFTWNYYWLLGLENDAPLDALSFVITNLDGEGQYDLKTDDDDIDFTAVYYWTGFYDASKQEFTQDESYTSEEEGFLKVESLNADRIKGSFNAKVYQESTGKILHLSGKFDLPVFH